MIVRSGGLDHPATARLLAAHLADMHASSPPGSVYALDPDIPIDRQRLSIGVSGAAATHRVLLDTRDLGPADRAPLVLPGPGVHRLRLVDIAGHVVDQVMFTMR